jgi:hypothetical protein
MRFDDRMEGLPGGTPCAPAHRLRGRLERHGHVAVPLPGAAAARADELMVAVPALLQRPATVRALDELRTAWAEQTGQHDAVGWARRARSDPRGGKCHLQTTAEFARFVADQPGSPPLLRAVLRRMDPFGLAADRLLAGFGAQLCTTVRANVYEADGGVPTHVDESALTVLFTDRPRSLLVAAGGRRAPLRPVAGAGWHAVVMPGMAAGEVLTGLDASPHAAVPAVDGPRLSISVFATRDPVEAS